MENSPNSLQPPRPPRTGLSKKPMFILLGIMLFVLLAFMFIMNPPEKKSKQENDDLNVSRSELENSGGTGVILPPQPELPATVIMPPSPPPPPAPVQVTKTEEVDPEAEALRKRRQQLYMNALTSSIKNGSGYSKPASSSSDDDHANKMADLVTRLEGQGSEAPALANSPNYDPAAAIDKEKFFSRADTEGTGWLLKHTREAGRLLEIKTGTIIPAILVGGINSDLPGTMIAQVSQNVYNTSNGKYLLIPQGSKLYGVYDSRVTWGQKRLLVAWNRIIFPDGSSVTLGSMPGADLAGYAGLKDKVNNHYFQIFGQAILMSGIMATTAYAVDRQDWDEDRYYRSGDDRPPRFQDELITMLAQQMGQASMEVLRRNINIAPTIEIRPGFQFNIIATKDVAFNEPYQPYPGP